uniref:Uncharacterized protein n=1 Tax=Setaria italica TaxID=4555 RepID=K3YKW3_SETIT
MHQANSFEEIDKLVRILTLLASF